MKIALALAVVATFVSAALATNLAFAAKAHRATPKTLKIVMRDPGCHWFMIGGKYKLRAAVQGSVRLVNYDEKTLKNAYSAIAEFMRERYP